jgi:hypothetical protein
MDRVSPAVYYPQLFEWGEKLVRAGWRIKKKQLFPGPSILFYFSIGQKEKMKIETDLTEMARTWSN